MVSLPSSFGLPFKRTRRISVLISQWGIVVSTGTLLWFAANFDKFMVKAANGTNIIYNGYIYLSLIFLFFVSSAIFIFLRGYMYYCDLNDERIREVTQIQERLVKDKDSLSKAEIDCYYKIKKEYDDAHKTYDDRDWIDTLRDKSIERAVKDFGGESMYTGRAPIPDWLGVGAIFYGVGLLLSVFYILFFVLSCLPKYT